MSSDAGERMSHDVIAFHGSTLAVASGTAVEVRDLGSRSAPSITRFEVDQPISWIEIGVDESSLLIWGGAGRRLWQWRRDRGVRPLAELVRARDAFGAGSIRLGGIPATLLSQHGRLRAFDADDRELLTADLRSPHAYYPQRFVALPGNRLALYGHHFSDTLPTVASVSLDALAQNAGAIQEALTRRAPLFDRAATLAVGPGPSNTAVVYRDPGDEEVVETEEDREDQRDVAGWAGLYLRDLDTGALLQRIDHRGVSGGGRMGASATHIAIERRDAVDIIDRSSGSVRTIPRAALDPTSMCVACWTADGTFAVTGA